MIYKKKTSATTYKLKKYIILIRVKLTNETCNLTHEIVMTPYKDGISKNYNKGLEKKN